MISTELLSKAVYERMHAEQQAFRKELLAMKPEDILDQAYVYAVREDILCAMENTELSMRQAYALLATETPLAQVYKTYLGKDTDYMEHIYDSLEDFSSDMAKLHQESREFPVYRHTFDYAVAHGEEKQYRDSFHANVACKGAIEKAISQHYKNNCMDALASQQVVHEFGFDRTLYVLANTIQLKDWDGRFSQDNKAWARSIQIAGGDEGIAQAPDEAGGSAGDQRCGGGGTGGEPCQFHRHLRHGQGHGPPGQGGQYCLCGIGGLRLRRPHGLHRRVRPGNAGADDRRQTGGRRFCCGCGAVCHEGEESVVYCSDNSIFVGRGIPDAPVIL